MFITLNAAWGSRLILVNATNILSVYENTTEGREVCTVKMVGGESFDVSEKFGEIQTLLDHLALAEFKG